MSETALAASCERRRNYRTLRACGYGRLEAEVHAVWFARQAALYRACALVAGEPGGWTLNAYGDAEYVTVGR
jgi:hypothetical protein